MSLLLKYKKYSQIIFWLWLSIIFVLSILPKTPNLKVELKSGDILGLDYFIHFAVYFVLALLFFYWKANNEFKVKLKSALVFIIIGLFCGVAIEACQLFIPGRAFNIIDIFANSGGVILGAIIPRFVYRVQLIN
ncbi:MAG: VanZ family protein [Bacteroidota bacterium]|nr:VanZ family protein [Bacteroidota bacterium]